MPDSFGNPLPGDFSNSFSNDLSLGALPTSGNNSFGANLNTSNLTDFLSNQSFEVEGIDGNLLNTAFSGEDANKGVFSNFFSNDKGGQGWGTAAIGAASGVAQTFLGFQQLSEGKKQNRIAQNQWQQQFDIQKNEYDRRTSERSARVAANSARKTSIGG